MDNKILNRYKEYTFRQEEQDYIDIDRYRYRARIVDLINEGIEKTPRVVVTLGCSFAFGQGSYEDEFMARLRPEGHGKYSDFDYVFKDHDLKDLLDVAEEHKLRIQTKVHHGDLPEDWMNHSNGHFEMVTKNMECGNSFVNKIGDYAGYVPINCSQNGNGNQAAITRLFSYPINWHKCEEIIVLWCYTDKTRYDVFNDQGLTYHQIGDDHKTMWPQRQEYNPEVEKFRSGETWHATQATWTQTCWSDVHDYVNFINQGIQIKTWCQAHGAKLTTFPAFVCVNYPTVEDNYCRTRIVRSIDQTIKPDGYLTDFQLAEFEKNANMEALKMFPWDSCWEPGGYDSFFSLAMAQEKDSTLIPEDVIGVGTENDWILPCGHPSGKGHELLAQELIKHLGL